MLITVKSASFFQGQWIVTVTTLTNREKSLVSGMLYDPNADGLPEDRKAARRMCHEIGHCFDDRGRNALVCQLFGLADETTNVVGPFFCDYGYNIRVGKNFFMNANGTILDCGPVFIGDDVMIGPNVTLCTAAHPLDAKTRYTYKEFAKPIHVGRQVWIGANVLVLPGVTIGEGSVIGGGSVVTKDVPPNTVVAGNPARVIRKELNSEG